MTLAGANGPDSGDSVEERLSGFDPTVPSPARVWNYFVGGKDNYASDRALAEKIMESVPEMSLGAKLTRKFIQRAVEELITEYGIRQFLDIGSGLPTADNTHEVAQRLAPDSRIVYVDNDPVVIRHAEALLNSTPEGACAYIEEDLRHPESILSGAARTLDFSKPVAVLLVQVMHFVLDSDDPYGKVARVMAGTVPGSFLVMVHGASDIGAEGTSEKITSPYNSTASVQVGMRTFAQFSRFFDGLEPIGPGLVSRLEWLRSGNIDLPADLPDYMSIGHSGIARKP